MSINVVGGHHEERCRANAIYGASFVVYTLSYSLFPFLLRRLRRLVIFELSARPTGWKFLFLTTQIISCKLVLLVKFHLKQTGALSSEEVCIVDLFTHFSSLHCAFIVSLIGLLDYMVVQI